MPIDLVPLARNHLEGFEPGAPDLAAFKEPYLSALKDYWVGRAAAALGGGKVLGVAGISVFEGCAYPWMVLSETARRSYPIRLTRLARKVIDGLFANRRVQRIEVHVDRDFYTGRRWIEFLGFTEQGSTQISMGYVRYGCTRAAFGDERRDKRGLYGRRSRRTQ